MTVLPSIEEQSAAFERYVEAKQRMDRTLTFEDGREAALAYQRFLAVFLDEDERKILKSVRRQ